MSYPEKDPADVGGVAAEPPETPTESQLKASTAGTDPQQRAPSAAAANERPKPDMTSRVTAAAAAAVSSMGVNKPNQSAGRTRRPQNYAAAVYGSVLAATVVISAGDLRSPLTLAVLLISSGFVFWIAHVYAATVASVHGGWHYGAIRVGMAHEWPVAFAAVPPAAAALISGLLPHVSVSDGVWAALIVAIAEQQLWGYAAVRHAKLSGSALTKTMLLNVFMGFIIVALKLGVGH